MPPLKWIYEEPRVTNDDLLKAWTETQEFDALKVRMNREYCAKLDAAGGHEAWEQYALTSSENNPQ